MNQYIRDTEHSGHTARKELCGVCDEQTHLCLALLQAAGDMRMGRDVCMPHAQDVSAAALPGWP